MLHDFVRRNGPIGSAVCVFTFNAQEDNNNIATVYNGDYLRHESQQWVTERNYQPFTVSVIYLSNYHIEMT